LLHIFPDLLADLGELAELKLREFSYLSAE
jgi:hypothetical protein